jgi:hypothetical protein
MSKVWYFPKSNSYIIFPDDWSNPPPFGSPHADECPLFDRPDAAGSRRESPDDPNSRVAWHRGRLQGRCLQDLRWTIASTFWGLTSEARSRTRARSL